MPACCEHLFHDLGATGPEDARQACMAAAAAGGATVLGAGGQASIHRSRCPLLGGEVAIKVFHEERRQARCAWLQEARSLARIRHPGVVRVHGAGIIAGRPMLCMELVRGWTLRAVLGQMRRCGPCDHGLRVAARRLRGLAGRLDFALALAETLMACHAQGVLHRDLKPSNVLVTPEGFPKLLDFGLAHLRGEAFQPDLHAGPLRGSAQYLAPEQVQDFQTGTSLRTEVFAFGLVAYELFSLRRPALLRCLGGPGQPIRCARPRAIEGLPPRLNRLLRTCLCTRPEQRYQDFRPIVRELRRIGMSPAAEAWRAGPAARAVAWMARRSRPLYGAAGA